MTLLEISAICHAVTGVCFVFLFFAYFTVLEKAALYKLKAKDAEEEREETLKFLHQERMHSVESDKKIYQINQILNPPEQDDQ